MSPEETRDRIHTLRSQFGQDDHTPERYLLDALFEMANSPPTTPESARVTLRRCQQIRECNQEVSKLREAQEGVRNQRTVDDLEKELEDSGNRVEALQKSEKEVEAKIERLLEAEHSRKEMVARLDAVMADMEGTKRKEMGVIQRTLVESQATRDMIEKVTKGGEHETGEAEGLASGSSHREGVEMSRG